MSVRELWDVRKELNAKSRQIDNLVRRVALHKSIEARQTARMNSVFSQYEAKIKELSTKLEKSQHYLEGYKRALEAQKRTSERAQRDVSKFKSGDYVKSVVQAVSNLERDNHRQQPLVLAAALRFNSYVDEYGVKPVYIKDKGMADMGWLAFPGSQLSSDWVSTYRLPYIYPGQGLSSSLDSFTPDFVKVGAFDVYRMISIFYSALAIAIINSTTMIDIATGVYNERFDSAVENGEDVTELCVAYNRATKVWRSYASRQAGDIKQFVWPMMNQLIKIANEHPCQFWGHDEAEVDRDKFIFPVALANSYESSVLGTDPGHFVPTTKMQSFIKQFGRGTRAVQTAYEQGLLDLNQVWGDWFVDVFGPSSDATNANKLSLTLAVKKTIERS